MMKRVIFSVVVLCLAAAAPADDFDRRKLDNWHHWRGPLANGTAPNADPPISWDEVKNVKWKVALPGKGSSTPIVWGDQVFVLTATKTDRIAPESARPKADPQFQRRTEPPANYYRFEVWSLDRRTGAVQWRKTAAEKVPHEGHHPSHTYCGGSPTTDGQRLYASLGSFGMYCYDLAGNLLWERDFGRLNTRLGWGEAVTPVVHGDSVLVNWDQMAD